MPDFEVRQAGACSAWRGWMQPNTGACQFFITDKAYPSLTGEYTIFGQVVDGQDVVGKIARVPGTATTSRARR